MNNAATSAAFLERQHIAGHLRRAAPDDQAQAK